MCMHVLLTINPYAYFYWSMRAVCWVGMCRLSGCPAFSNRCSPLRLSAPMLRCCCCHHHRCRILPPCRLPFHVDASMGLLCIPQLGARHSVMDRSWRADPALLLPADDLLSAGNTCAAQVVPQPPSARLPGFVHTCWTASLPCLPDLSVWLTYSMHGLTRPSSVH